MRTHSQTRAAGMGTASAGRGRSVQKRAPLFRLWSVPCDPGWVCGIEVVGLKLHYFCAIFASSNELCCANWPRAEIVPKVDRFLTEMVGGVGEPLLIKGFVRVG